MATNLKPQTGWIGIFDILGFRNLLTNTEKPHAAAKIVEEVFDELEGLVAEEVPKLADESIQGNLRRPGIRIVSDMLLLYQVEETNENAFLAMLDVFLFCARASILARKMFQKGLPVRGIITHGAYVESSRGFYGKAFAEAYSKLESLDIAACMLDVPAEEELKRVRGLKSNDPDSEQGTPLPDPETKQLLARYCVPLKHGAEASALIVNLDPATKTWLKEDVRRIVFEAFWAHGKDVPRSVLTKVNNTEQMLRYFKFLKQH